MNCCYHYLNIVSSSSSGTSKKILIVHNVYEVAFKSTQLKSIGEIARSELHLLIRSLNNCTMLPYLWVREHRQIRQYSPRRVDNKLQWKRIPCYVCFRNCLSFSQYWNLLKETGKDLDDLCDFLHARERGEEFFFITIGVTLDCNSHFTDTPVIAQDLANYRIHFVHVEDKKGGGLNTD